MSRPGKIARLPRPIRDKLNLRLEDGQYGPKPLEWLNPLPEVQSTLDAAFGRRPVIEKNLSDWKQGGYEDWLRREERCQLVRNLAEEAWDLDSAAGGATVNNRLCRILAAELAALAPRLLAATTDVNERLRLLAGLVGEADRLRKLDQKEAGLVLARERWDFRHERLLEEAAERKVKKEKEALTAPSQAAAGLGPLPGTPMGHQNGPESPATGAGESHESSPTPPDDDPWKLTEDNGRQKYRISGDRSPNVTPALLPNATPRLEPACRIPSSGRPWRSDSLRGCSSKLLTREPAKPGDRSGSAGPGEAGLIVRLAARDNRMGVVPCSLSRAEG